MAEDNQNNQDNQKTEKEDNSDSNSANIELHKKTSRTFVNQGIDALIRFSPVGGSGFILVSSLLNQDWIVSIISFPFTLVSVIWASYSESVLTRFSEIYKQRGKQDVDSFMASVDKVDKTIKETIKWQLAKTEEKYLRCLKITDDHLFYLTEGLEQKETSLLLNDVFIELRITGQNISIPTNFSDSDEHLKESIERDIWSFLKEAQENQAYHSLWITAKGGLGKTTLLKHITYIYANKKYRRFNAPNLIPVLLYLRRWQNQITQENPPNLPTLIEQYYLLELPLGKDLKLPPNWAENHLKNGKMLIMLDGFDEVKENLRQGVSEWIAQQLKNYPYSYFILASRPYAVDDYQGKIKPKTRLSIIPFDDKQKARFIQRWYECRVKNDHKKNSLTAREITAKATLKANNLIEQITQRPELSQLARIPLMLNMIVSLHSLSQSRKLPNKRSDLYEQIISLQLGSRPLARDIELILGASQSEHILQGLALEMMIQEQKEVEYQDLISKINKQFSTYKIDSSVEVTEFLKEIETISELIVKSDDSYGFAHLSFQEYLASKEIIKTEQENILIDNWDKSWWQETILLYSAQFIPTNLLQYLIKINSQESIKLAKLCLDEIPEKKLAKLQQSLNFITIEEIASVVNNLLFAKLEEYLKNGQWREADEETTRLMLQLGDKDEKGYLDVEDCKNFPREELRTIDQLWLKYSDNKFGFSVQKQIYLEVGGKLDNYDYDSYDYDSYKRMGDCVGWRKNNQWLSDSQLIFTFDKNTAPKGFLPFFFDIGGGSVGFSRFDPEAGSAGFFTYLSMVAISYLFSKL